MKGDGATCLHCGDHQQLSVPQNMESFVAVARAFEKVHANCPKPTVQSGADR